MITTILKIFSIRNWVHLKRLQIELFFLRWWERNVIADFPYSPKCFDCNLGSCEVCPRRN